MREGEPERWVGGLVGALGVEHGQNGYEIEWGEVGERAQRAASCSVIGQRGVWGVSHTHKKTNLD